MIQTLERHVGAAERDDEVQRQEPPDRGAEHEMAESQDPAQVEVARLVNAVQGLGQAAVQPQRGIAAEEAPRTGAVGLLELVPRNRRRGPRPG